MSIFNHISLENALVCIAYVVLAVHYYGHLLK
jgi:hypothetical protein